jgi:hypothetical protein
MNIVPGKLLFGNTLALLAVPVVRLSVAAIYNSQATAAEAAAVAAAEEVTDAGWASISAGNGAGSSSRICRGSSGGSSSSSGTGGRGSSSGSGSSSSSSANCTAATASVISAEVKQQLLQTALNVVTLLSEALNTEVVEKAIGECTQRIPLIASLTDPNAAALQLLLSADFLTLLLVYVAAVTKQLHETQNGRAGFSIAAAVAAAYTKRAAWEQQQQQMVVEEDLVKVPEWHRQLAAGLGLPGLNLGNSDSLQVDSIVLTAFESVLQARCKLAGAVRHTLLEWVIDIPAAAANAAVTALALSRGGTGCASSSMHRTGYTYSSSTEEQPALHLRHLLMPQQLLLPLLLTAVELQALKCDAVLSYATIPFMDTALEPWIDLQQQQQQQGSVNPVLLRDMADFGLLPQLLHLLGPSVLFAVRQAAKRTLGEEVVRSFGQLLCHAVVAGELAT